MKARTTIFIVINLESNTITRITSSPIANEYYPVLTQDNKLYYISDANGINNIYQANADGTNARPLTNSVSKIDQISISNDGTRLCFSTMHKGAYDLFLLRNPESLHVDSLPLTEYRKNDGGQLVARSDTSHKSAVPDSQRDMATSEWICTTMFLVTTLPTTPAPSCRRG